ncbi:MAG: phage integrase SAM-like domain-containing protein [Gelidibacter sp.]|nr:phage integrase SAM-like domain-containing protein [Gelidibacter sp.]
MNEREQGKYLSFIGMVEDFEGKNKLRIKDITSRQITDFVRHLAEQNYASKTIQRHISRFKFFLFRAEEENMSVNNAFKQKVYVPKAESLKEPYFDEEELEKIFNADLKGNKTLENVRDNLIIACWTGLRVSDFLGQLDISNFIDDFIEVTTQKTKSKVVIPVHPHVKRILINRKGQLPEKMTDQTFNKRVKLLCKELKFNDIMKGGIVEKVKKRKVIGMHPKWKLITSHVGRRSFATNHYGKIPNSVIMGVCGWTKEEMMLHYIKKSNRQHAVALKQYWDKIYS